MVGPCSPFILQPNETLNALQDDVNLGLEHLYGTFDMVHARVILLGIYFCWACFENVVLNTCAGITDARELVRQAWTILRPGGLVLLQEMDYEVYDDNHKCMEAERVDAPNHSWFATFIRCSRLAARQKDIDMQIFKMHKTWLAEFPDYEKIEHEHCWMPIGARHPNPRLPSWFSIHQTCS